MKWHLELNKIKEAQFEQSDVITLNISGKTKGFTVPRSLLTSVKGSSLEAMFSGRHHIKMLADGNPYLNRDADTFKLLISYLRNDREEFPIPDQTQKYLFEKEVEFWGLSNINNKLDKKLVSLMKSEPVLNPDWTQTPLDLWKRLGPLDLNEVHENNPIDRNPDLVYLEKENDNGMNYGQYKGNKKHGIARRVSTRGDGDKNQI